MTDAWCSDCRRPLALGAPCTCPGVGVDYAELALVNVIRALTAAQRVRLVRAVGMCGACGALERGCGCQG